MIPEDLYSFFSIFGEYIVSVGYILDELKLVANFNLIRSFVFIELPLMYRF